MKKIWLLIFQFGSFSIQAKSHIYSQWWKLKLMIVSLWISGILILQRQVGLMFFKCSFPFCEYTGNLLAFIVLGKRQKFIIINISTEKKKTNVDVFLQWKWWIESLRPSIVPMCQMYKYVAQRIVGAIGSGCTVQLPLEDTLSTVESSYRLNAVRATSVEQRWIPSLTKRKRRLNVWYICTLQFLCSQATGSIRPSLVMKP